jgi:threonine/homoserine/homoserine lactone efflux protein
VPTLSTLLVFATFVVGFAALPGPTNLWVLGRGIGVGTRPALAGAAGCAAGASVYVVATAFGLSALLASSHAVLAAVHYLGVAYLVFLGLRAIFAPPPEALTLSGGPDSPRGHRFWRAFRQGLFIELSNPKVALFFLALFPQFIDATRGPAWSQVLALGAVFVTISLMVDSTYAFGSGVLGRWLRKRPSLVRRQTQLSGGIYLGLGAWIAVSGTDSAAPKQ